MSKSGTLKNQELYLAEWTKHNKRSAIQEMLQESASPDVISFALGLPSAELFPTEDFRKLLNQELKTNKHILQYRPPLDSLKVKIIELMKLRGVECSREHIFLTNGSQQGANLLINILLGSNCRVILEDKTYTGFQQVLRPYNPKIEVISSNSEVGFDLNELENILKTSDQPTLFYTVADGHNPLSYSLSIEKREGLSLLARKYNLKIIEDDPYGFINYETENLAAIKSFNLEDVFYIGTFSKILAPSLRAGWVVVPEELIGHLENVKEASDINTATFSHHLINSYFETGKFNAHLSKIKTAYKARRDQMSDILESELENYVNFQRPSNGLFIWLDFNSNINTEKLMTIALKREKIAFIPGNMFNVTDDTTGTNSARMNFSALPPDLIEEGMNRLVRLIKSNF